MGVRHLLAVWAVGLAATLAPQAQAAAPACSSAHWVGAWSAAPSDADHPGFQDQSVRMVVAPHMGGEVLRLRLSNRLGSSALTLDSVTVGLRFLRASIVEGTLRQVTFDGSRAVKVGPGAVAVSDPVALRFEPFQDLVVSAYSSLPTGPATEHFTARQTTYITSPGKGDHSRDIAGPAYDRTATSWFWLTGVEVDGPPGSAAVAAFGDSITDGFQGQLLPLDESEEGFGQNARYPDFLSRRLLAAGAPLSVLNSGITGNRLLKDGFVPHFGPSGLSRLRTDLIDHPGISDAIVLEGINDIGEETPRELPAAELIAGYTQAIGELRAAGIRVFLGTLTPSGRSTTSGYGAEATNRIREEVNNWIRTSGAADGVIDFDAALRDPADHRVMLARFDSGDGLHPNLAGYRRMAEEVDLTRFGHHCPKKAAVKAKAKRKAKRKKKRRRRARR